MKFMTANPWRSWWFTCAAMSLIAIAVLMTLIPLGTIPYPRTGDFSDAAVAHWPNADFLRSSMLEHQAWPLWNPLRLLGQPFAANPLSKVWYPPQWLVLLLPPTIHLDVLIYLHAGWLVIGMLLWARCAGLSRLAGITAAYGWLLAPKLIAHLGAGHLDLWYAASWIPWLLWATLIVAQRGSISDGVRAGAIAALLALADLRMAFYMLPVAAVYAGLQSQTLRFPANWKVWVAAGSVLLGLTAVLVIPLISLSSSLTRSLITPEEASAFSLSPQLLLGSLIPNIAGSHELMTYIGIPVIALALVSLRHPSKRIVVGLWIIAFIAAIWAMGANVPFFLPIVRVIRGAAWFRIPSRAWFIVALMFALLSAHGLDALLQRGLPKRARPIAIATTFGGVVWLVATLQLVLPAETQIAFVAIGVLLILTGLSLGLRLLRWPHSEIASAVALLTISFISFLALDSTFVKSRPVELSNQWVSATDDACSVVYAPTFTLLDPSAAHANLRTLHSADPFQLIWSARAVADAVNISFTGYSITAPPIPPHTEDLALAMQDISFDYGHLARLGVTDILVPYELPIPSTSGSLVNVKAGVHDYRLEGDSAPLRICTLGPNRYEVDFQRDTPRDQGLIPLAMAWSPGWHAWVNGRSAKMQRVREALIGVAVPNHTYGKIVLVYQPTADYIGMAISGTTLVTLAVGWLIHRRAKHNE